METSGSRGKFRRALRKWLPWIVTVLIFVYLFERISVEKVLLAVQKADLVLFLPPLIFFVLFYYFWDSLVNSRLFTWFGVPTGYREMLPVRGATYLFIVLNYMVGQGGLGLVMNRWKKISISRATTIVIFGLYMDFFTLLALSAAGAFRLPDVDLAMFFTAEEAGHLVRFLTISWAVFFLHFLFHKKIINRYERLQWVRKITVLNSFHEAPFARYIKLGALKSVQLGAGIICNYIALRAFGVNVPLLEFAVMMPLVWLIGSIPVTVMRMGTIQAAMIWLVGRYAEGADPELVKAQVLAFSLLWEVGLNLGRFGIGAVCAAFLPKELWKPSKRAPAEEADAIKPGPPPDENP